MSPADILNLLSQYNLFNIYTPIVAKVGFSHPLTFALIAGHNTLGLTYLLFTVVVAYPALREKSWYIPVAVVGAWTMIGFHIMAALNISATAAMATVLPHGWIEFLAIAYWIRALRGTTMSNRLPNPPNMPTVKDYFKAIARPRRLLGVAKADLMCTLRMAKLSIVTLSKDLKRAYVITLFLVILAALVETYVTPIIGVLA